MDWQLCTRSCAAGSHIWSHIQNGKILERYANNFFLRVWNFFIDRTDRVYSKKNGSKRDKHFSESKVESYLFFV